MMSAAHQVASTGDAEEREELPKIVFRASQAHPVAYKDHRPFGTIQCLDGLADLLHEGRGIESGRDFARIKRRQMVFIDGRGLHIERDIDPDRAGTAVTRQIDRLFEVIADAGRVQYRNGVFRDGLDDGYDVQFLDAELAHAQRGSIRGEHAVGPLHLTGNHQHGSGIEPGSRHPGDRIGPARSRGYQGNPEIVGRLGVALGRHGAGLLVGVANGLQGAALRQGGVQVHGAAAGHQEDVLHALGGDEAHHVIG
jgi:hypothetical protein